eukprot:CAMPEP_0175164120 /NCGR_PEP_ID=MMETSP0087-20121206/26199_1 /TAXON_ID=136419 /ORGANISM="Unknown Unknown, Strain D1" /LENGTH=146 /DNA_ID=CAMNT_0016453041 /DNA_START=436 /DNA_END=873 /DNA_ORIENTATION=-
MFKIFVWFPVKVITWLPVSVARLFRKCGGSKAEGSAEKQIVPGSSRNEAVQTKSGQEHDQAKTDLWIQAFSQVEFTSLTTAQKSRNLTNIDIDLATTNEKMKVSQQRNPANDMVNKSIGELLPKLERNSETIKKLERAVKSLLEEE